MVMTASAGKQDPFGSVVQRSSENVVRTELGDAAVSTLPTPMKRKKMKKNRKRKQPKKESRIEDVKSDPEPTIIPRLMNAETSEINK